MKTIGFGTILGQVSGMDRAVAFYRDILRLTPIAVSPGWSEFALGPVRLGLHPPFVAPPESPGSEAGGWILGIEVDDLAGLRQALLDSGAHGVGEYHGIPGGVVLDFCDTEGQRIQAVQRGISAAEIKGDIERR